MPAAAHAVDLGHHRSVTRALVRSILEHPADHPWVEQELGLFATRLGEDRRYRLHLWDPERADGDLVIHDHPFDLTSTVVAGEITNTRYVADPAGVEYERQRYAPSDEQERRRDAVLLTGSAERFAAGQTYRQRAPELHTSAQIPGTVTILHMARVQVPELTVCRLPGRSWVSGRAVPADTAAIRDAAAVALERMAHDDDQRAAVAARPSG